MGAQASQAGPRAAGQSQQCTWVTDGARAVFLIKKMEKAIFVKRVILVGKPFFLAEHQKSGSYFYIFFLKKNTLNTSSSIRTNPMGSKDLPFGKGSVGSVDKTDNL